MADPYRFPLALRDVIAGSLPQDTSLYGKTPELRHTYLPSTHAKALRPDNMLVVGIRGSGKSFWWAALQQPEHRAGLGKSVGITDKTMVSTGFGEGASLNYPGKDVILSLVGQYEPRRIWQTVAIWHVRGRRLGVELGAIEGWKARVEWVQNHPEEVERCLLDVDSELERLDTHHLVLFDALDRTADEWTTMHALVRGLLQVLLDFRSYKRIRLKAFVRPDQIEDPSVATFPDSSKVLSQKIDLYWPRHELYGLFWQYLANASPDGHLFRDGCLRAFAEADWPESSGVWTVPEALRGDEDVQRRIFHGICGPWMGRDRRRGFPYTWLPNHLGDARREVSPRSFLAALRHAAEDRRSGDQEYALHYESIKRGVQEASRIRVREIQEDYPWVEELLAPLSGISVPCSFAEIKEIWERNRVLEDLTKTIEKAGVRLPPSHIASGSEGVFEDLLGLGLVERISDNRVNLPDVYRVGYGIGRRGGVKPVAR